MRIVPSAETRLGYIFHLSRPRYWHYLGSPVILGVIYAAESISDVLSLVPVVFMLYFLTLGNVFLYGVNDAFDVDTDEHNEKKTEDGKETIFQEDPAVIATIIASGVLSFPFFFVIDSTVAAVVLAGWLVLSITYSSPPLRLKSIPFVDSLSNGLYILPGVAAYIYVTGGEFPPLAAVAGFWLWTMGYHTFAAIPDIEPDRKAGVRTLATVLGQRWSLAYCGTMWLAAAITFSLYHPFAGVIFLIYPFIDAYIYWNDVDVARAYWWFPTINAVTGIPLLIPGLWVLLA